MQLQYTMCQQDFIAFNLHYLAQSDAVKKRIRMTQIFGAVVIALAVIAFSVYNGFRPLVLGLALLAAVLYVLYIPYSVQNNVRKNVKRVLASGVKTALGEKTLSLTASTIELTGSGEHSSYAYTSIQRIVQDTAHFYIDLGDMQALIVPLRAFADASQQQEFYQALAQKITTTDTDKN